MGCGTIKKVRTEKAKIMTGLKTVCGGGAFISRRGDMLLSGRGDTLLSRNISSINMVKLG